MASQIKYHERTRKKVLSFLKSRRKAFFKDIVKLGTEKPRINFHTLETILDALQREGLIRESKLGRFRIYEYVEKR